MSELPGITVDKLGDSCLASRESRAKALIDMGKHFGMFSGKVDVDLNVGVCRSRVTIITEAHPHLVYGGPTHPMEAPHNREPQGAKLKDG